MNVEWKDSYCIGDKTADQQHQKMFELANALFVADNQAALQLGAINLYKHVREHFAAEEALMRAVDFPDYRDHVASHNQLLSQLNAVSQGIGKGQWDKQQIHTLMTDWTLRHILFNDAKMADYISRS